MNRLEIINLCLSGQDCAEQAGQIRQSVTVHEARVLSRSTAKRGPKRTRRFTFTIEAGVAAPCRVLSASASPLL